MQASPAHLRQVCHPQLVGPAACSAAAMLLPRQAARPRQPQGHVLLCLRLPALFQLQQQQAWQHHGMRCWQRQPLTLLLHHWQHQALRRRSGAFRPSRSSPPSTVLPPTKPTVVLHCSRWEPATAAGAG